MKPALIALVGRPNVGKSTLFNALTKKRQALVADFSGVTRDRRFGEAEVDPLPGNKVRVVDTGGWMPAPHRRLNEQRELLEKIEEQVLEALDEAAVILQIVDAREGLHVLDQDIANFLRKLGRPYMVIANKVDVPQRDFLEHEFYSLGAKEVIPLSAEHRLGFENLWSTLLPYIKDNLYLKEDMTDVLSVCIVGRPNVGKSSLLNRLLGKERAVASSKPGTTTDPVDEIIEIEDQKFLLIDTAGIRRPSKREHDVEDLGVMYAKRNLAKADVALFVLDSEEGLTSQDGTIASLIEDAGSAAIILANKWDLAPHRIIFQSDAVKKFTEKVHEGIPLLDFAPVVAISAQEGHIFGACPGKDALDAQAWTLPENFSDLWSLIRHLVEEREQKISQDEIQDYVDSCIARAEHVTRESGPLKKIHQVGTRPPQFLAYVKDANKVSESLRRFLSRAVRERYGFRGNPIRWTFRHKSRNKK